MKTLRRWRSGAGVLGLAVVSACADTDPTTTPSLDVSPQMASGQIANGLQQVNGFYFLPPLAESNPNPQGIFNPRLAPALEICTINTPGSGEACNDEPAVIFGPGSAVVQNDQYVFSWDTDGPETPRLRASSYYRLRIVVGDRVVGSMDLDPQNPNGPGQSTADAYAFRLGETIPVKFWMSLELLCTGEGYVSECITGAVIDQSGGLLALDGVAADDPRLAVRFAANSLPVPSITVVLERIEADLFLADTGVECIPLFDAPQFGECFRVTTFPSLESTPLTQDAIVSICIDPGALGLSVEQQETLNMVRYNNGIYEALRDAPGDCTPTQTAGLLPVPESGLLRYAALGLNTVASAVLPQPLWAAEGIRLGGFTSSFSRFRFALPGQMLVTAGDGESVTQRDVGSSDPAPVVDAAVTVIDYLGFPVADARVRFTTQDGTLSQNEVVTGSDGVAQVGWTLDDSSAGTKTLTASALGLTSGPAPDEEGNAGLLVEESVTMTVTVIGPPSSLGQSPGQDPPLQGIAGGSAGDLSVSVADEAGTPVPGAQVTWSGDGSVPDGQTGTDGSYTGTWTLPTTAGPAQVTATVGTLTATFTADVAPGPAVAPSYGTVDTQGTAGLELPTPIVVTVADQYGNPRPGDPVTFRVTSGGGSVSAPSAVTGTDGSASVTWTLGSAVGTNTLEVSVAGADGPFVETFTVEGRVGVATAPGSATGDGQAGVVGQALVSPLSVTVTDAFGNPRAGDVVTWSAGGVQTPVATDASGVSRFTWTLGTTAGSQTATAVLPGFESAPVVFTADARPGSLDRFTVVGPGPGPHRVGAVISGLSVTLADQYGNVRAGDPVSWVADAGSGVVQGQPSTGTDGVAAATWTLGSMPGTQGFTVSSGAKTQRVTVVAECFDGYGVADVNGTFGPAEWACARTRTFSANISGGATPAEVHWMDDGRNLYIAVRIAQRSLDKVNDLRIDFDNDGDGVAEVNDDAIGIASGRFFDEYLTDRCVNRSQAGCGAADRQRDGNGAVGNDGTWTVFEVVHPLASGEVTDLSATTGSTFGFFLSLQSGNGAQGNTQFPGFRSYIDFTVVGGPN